MADVIKKKVLAPIKILPYDPENLHLSKAQFQEKERKRKELEARMRAFETQARADIEEESTPKVEKPVEKSEAPDLPAPKKPKSKK